MTTWRGLGLQMIIFLAGLQAIPAELYEAASVDGAGPVAQVPPRHAARQLRPTLLFSAVIASIGLLQFFEEPFVMTEGGPLDSTLSVAFHAYNEFSFGNYGYTAAISYVLFVVIAAHHVPAVQVPEAEHGVARDDDPRPPTPSATADVADPSPTTSRRSRRAVRGRSHSTSRSRSDWSS